MRTTRTLVPLLAAVATAAATVVPVATVADAAVGACPMVEAEVPGVPSVANPYDPDQADVRVTFTGPGGARLDTPAFATVEHSRALVGGQEQLTETSGVRWMVRATPPVAGDWTWQATIRVGGVSTTTAPVAFRCEADPDGHGVPRVSDVDGRYLAFADGSPFVPRGENLSWYGPGGTYDYDRWLDQLAARGANWVRVWMPSWAMGIEWSDTPLGDYRNRMDRAWQLDHVLAAAQERGIVVQLVLLNHGAFSTTTNSEWAQNPYNAANGGPLAEPAEFFTDPTARALFEQRLRYVVARWGAHPNLVWELWNEVDATGGDPAAVTAWHAEIAAAIDELDPADHLVTTSTSNFLDFAAPTPRWDALWRLPAIDLVQVHMYGIGDSLPLNLVPAAATTTTRAATYGKPVHLSEVGIDLRGPAETRAADPTGKGVHEGAWIGFFSGGAGAGMPWWWDGVIEPDDLYGTMLDGLDALLDGVDVPAERFDGGGATAGSELGALDVFALRGRTTALAWLRNPSDWWHQPDARPVAATRLTLEGLASGTWRTTLVDPFTGVTTPGPPVTSDGGTATLQLDDAWVAEQAVRLELEEPATAETPPTAGPPATSAPGARPSSATPTFTG